MPASDHPSDSPRPVAGRRDDASGGGQAPPRRAHLLILDSHGIGGAADAARYGDEGSDTFGHVALAAARGDADREGLRAGPLVVPHLARLGLLDAHRLATGTVVPGLEPVGDRERAAWTHAGEVSRGKDTPSGHWEIAGVPVPFAWDVFPPSNSFPPALVDALVAAHDLPGILGNEAASGTEIIERLGDEHVRSGKPILYTSADSVVQIAAHEVAFGLDRLMAVCRTAREWLDGSGLRVGRVIARPFADAGEGEPGAFARTGNRRDLAVPPPEPTLLDRAVAAGRRTLCVGKIADIYAHSGVAREIKASGNAAIGDATLRAMDDAADGDLVVSNFVDFDMLYGHRRDVPGYAAAIEAFDRRLPEIEARLQPGDLLVLTADHGCDPTWAGTDHTRERVPVLMTGPGIAGGPVRAAETFADIGETIAAHLGLRPGPHGAALL